MTKPIWYAYRPFNEEHRTKLFIGAWFVDQNRYYERTKLDEYFDDQGNLCKHPRPNPGAYADNFIPLRIFADRKCMPYDQFWAFGYMVLECDRASDIAHLLKTLSKFRIAELWQERRKATIVTATEDYMKADKIGNYEHSFEYRNYLIESVNKKYGSRAHEVFGWLIKDGHLKSEWVSNYMITGRKGC